MHAQVPDIQPSLSGFLQVGNFSPASAPKVKCTQTAAGPQSTYTILEWREQA
jgi:hypothetical protein